MESSIIAAVFGLLICALALAIKKSSKFLIGKLNTFVRGNKKLENLEMTKIGLELAEKVISTVAETTVGKLEEIAGKDIRQKIKNGETGKEELFALAEVAYREIVSEIKPELMGFLSQSVNDAELYIRNQIEHQLLLLKAKLNGGTTDGNADTGNVGGN